MELTLSSREVGDRTVVEVGGEVDVYTAPKLDAELTSLVGSGKSVIVVDFSGVEFLDSTGLGVLVKALKHVKEAGGSLSVVATSERIIKVFRITGLDAAIPLHDTVDSACSD